ncbi:MAG TPA: FkbM family methyltransferase [Alphaproteobacteria bacterium]|nr:FkbM family methyltransferase [Alphaproteobacteria bacterium]
MMGETGPELMQQAIACHRSGRFDEAAALYLGAGRLAGDQSVVALPLGCLYLQTGRVQEAREVLDRLVERQPQSAEAWTFAGHARLRAGSNATAAYAFLRALALHREDSNLESLFWDALDRAGGMRAATDPALADVVPSLAELHAELFGSPVKLTHPIFTQYSPWKGTVPPGFRAMSYGSLIRSDFYGPASQQTSLEVTADPLSGLPPSHDEEYFEWIDLLESIAAAKKSFTMVELGAGFGRWIVAAASVIRLYRDIPFHLVGVEAEDRHFEMMRQHFLDNGLDPDEHRLVKAAISEKDGEVHFMRGHSEEWWGQHIVEQGTKYRGYPDAEVVAVPCMSIASVLEGLDLVDLIDMDIQGAEADAVRGSRDALCAKVKRVHIGTHGAEIERTLIRLFTGMGWICCNNFSYGQMLDTHYGKITFGDGVQTWINPVLQSC